MNRQTHLRIAKTIENSFEKEVNELAVLYTLKCIEEDQLFITPETIKKMLLVTLCTLLTNDRIIIKEKK